MLIEAVAIDLKPSFAQLFTAIADEPWALLLDSCAHAQGNYDFIFWQPAQVVTVADDWPAQLQQLMAQVPSYQGPADLPFQGGLAGAWSYDAGRALERLPEQAKADIQLPEIAVGLYTHALIRCHRQQQTWLLCPSTEQANWQRFWQRAATPSPATAAFKLANAWQSNMTKASYLEKFTQVQDYLRAGDCYQVNLAQRFQAPFQGDPWRAYLHLRQRNQAPFSGFMRLGEGALLSHSPERFLATDAQGHVETKPIKGTRPRHSDPSTDQALADELQNASKDRAENVMIVDLLRNDLSRVCLPGSVQVPKLFAIESYPAVHHLVSTVVGQLPSPQDALSLLAACFPGGSITGAPKIRAMEVIDELEPHRRSFYCGSLGYFSQHGASDTNICIRTLVTAGDQIYCWAGGGLVIDSNGDEEYQETLDKVAKILPELGALNHS
ncbi:aminodeoxychorismate synthase, component I [Pseudidiomarina sediminum]|uniref:aminodeoxychorismate synthase n=1 Tax=Pseudidiomarina sediminum TaxID=431675 RepID=A0A432Z3I8_9GAMM|nr:aminodeoxychorismate synthase component I [Pseudidiomarina sediminum]MBY6064753.1 aminodeoxychorismate synthase component I [Pseudidiomarina sediminum]RUO72441.1 aminodeoxychorismate synthase, component I [Pseudidiomarina sediminum]